MTYTFFLNINSVVTQVYPLNWLECTLIDEKEQDQQFYRRKFNGELVFGGNRIEVTTESGQTVVSLICEDFHLIYDITDPCTRIELLILRDLDIYWEGFFSPADGKWDFDAETFTVTPMVTDDYSDWDIYGGVEFNILNVTPTVTVDCNGWSYTRNRWLMDVIEYLADQVFTDCTVVSRFFTEATNYVTLSANKYTLLTLAQKSDIKNPTSSDPATVALLSFNECMDILRGMFNVYWSYNEATGILTVEHVSLFTSTAGVNLTAQEITYGSNKYRYLKERMPKHEYWYAMEAKSADFIYGHAWYDSLCVDQNPETNVWEYRNRVTTEIEYIQQSILDGDEGAISNDGFVMLCNYADGGLYYTYQMAGIYDTVIRFNMPLAWSYLLHYFHRHDRVLLNGYFNLTATTFVSAKKRKTQDINAIICADHGYTPTEYITTELGETYFAGEKGYVDKAVIKPYGEVNFTLLYGPVDNANTAITDDPVTMRVLQDGLDVYTYLSQANIYDTYYSVLTNDGLAGEACDVIMIPAGTMYQHDTLSQLNPIATVAWNFTDASLTGWSISVNNSTSYTTCTDADCDTGAPAPPAVPAVPTITGHNQATTCGPVRVSWGAVADATYYVLQRNPNLAGAASWETQYTGAALYYDDYDAGMQEGVTFLYRLAAGNISGLSAWSAEHTVNDVMCGM